MAHPTLKSARPHPKIVDLAQAIKSIAQTRHRFSRYAEQVFRSLQFAFLPGNCLLCGCLSRRRIDLCEVCEQRLPWNHHSCNGCAMPLDRELVGLCDQCRVRRLAFDSARAPFLYQDEIARVLSQAKFRAGFTGLALLSELCAPHFARETEKPDMLVPVPLSWQRMMARGFNQSALLARDMGRRLGTPVRFGLLKRRRNTRAQSGLSRRARLKNLVGAFEVRQPLCGQRVALIDDVITTGATALAATKALKKAGASRVVVWACARTPNS